MNLKCKDDAEHRWMLLSVVTKGKRKIKVYRCPICSSRMKTER